ncbi:MAG: hypothetical protein ACI4DY_03700 [Monoglobaceae bacterium]
MVRTPLKQGEIIQLNNRQYTIDKVIGDGATCIVYSAYYSDGSGHPHHVNIKECYPHNVDIARQEQKLCWNSAEDKSKSITAFQNAYDKVMLCQNGNFTVHAFDIFENNNTAYIIMDANDGVTFDKDSADNIADILKTVKLLAHVVGEYHKNGYLHLDIKPSNFLVYPRPSEHIVLFDMDTVMSLENIRLGNISGCSYSDGWAAPEQKQGKISKLCPATDIFAIGAILFEKIMGRQVDASDLGVFADWEFEGKKFENVNPKIKRLLSHIFKKTLAVNIKRRYQTTDELIDALQEAIKTAEDNVYLLSDNISCTSNFVGRESELANISEAFAEGNQLVFLYGFGGIGKTEIAKMYAQKHSKEYDAVLFVKYDSNFTLQDLLDDVPIENFDGNIKEHRRKLRTLLTENVLVIVDNFDIELGEDNGLEELLKTKAQILVSTRTDFSELYIGGTKYIEIKPLPADKLKLLFVSCMHSAVLSNYDNTLLDKVLQLIENNTLAAVVLSKQMYYSGWNFENLYNNIKQGFAALANVEQIIVTKDGTPLRDNSLNILRVVFRISNLSAGQEQVLRDMALLNFIKVSKDVYREIALSPKTVYRTIKSYNSYEITEMQTAQEVQNKIPDATLNSFNKMVELGYLQKNNDYYSLHSIIEELTFTDLSPNLSNCAAIYNYVLNTVEWFDEKYEVSDAAQVEAEHKAAFLTKIFRRLDLNDEDVLRLALDWLEHFYNDLYFSAYAFNKDLELLSLFNRIEVAIKNSSNKELQFKAYHTLLQVWLQECQTQYLIESISTQKHDLCKKNVEKYFRLSLEIAKELDSADAEQCVYADVSKAVSDSRPKRELTKEIYDDILSSITTSRGDIPNHVIQEAYAAAPELLQVDAWEKEFYNLPLTNEEQMELEELRKPKTTSDIQDDSWSDEIDRVLLLYRKAENKEDFARDVYNNCNYTPEQKAVLFDEFLTASFAPLAFARIKEQSREAIKSTDWKQVESMLHMQRNIFDSYDGWVDSDMYGDYCYWRMETYLYKTLISIIFDRNDRFKYIDELVDFDTSDRHTLLSDTSFGIFVNEIVSACWAMDKNRYSLPFMKKELDFYLPDDSDIDNEWIEDHFKMIENIADAALLASDETRDDPQQHDEFIKTYQWAIKLLNKATNKTFELKPDTKE